MGAPIRHGRMKAKYNPVPNARERAYHEWLLERELCFCCWQMAEVVHHPLQRHPDQRWRRDHEFVVPMAADCHMRLHAAGDERKWAGKHDVPAIAAGFRKLAQDEGIL